MLNRYLIELHLVVHEIAMYLEEIKLYGNITRYSESFPVYVWIESPWDIDIIERIYGIKKVWEPIQRGGVNTSVLRDITYERGLE